ncbi:tyrosine-protein phosphatase [Clostridium fallax]|uniref:Tyrosine phosphatase family protein n=1 Tax=Clostridium fallax TaxID=1533 RepID=A0A1M4WVK0_9CLOT|nr:Tyrosine phosphatase family protein [Clostridium fallax]SQB07418.1 protein tyrosine/serine phosphatase [Clostridium fallax]
MIAERIVPLKKFHNFRNLGRYKTRDGRKVKWGLFYRSEDLSKLKDDDLKYFKTLGIKYILDYRSKEEKERFQDFKLNDIKNINISAMTNLDVYKIMPINNKDFKELMKLFKNPKDTAIL